MAPSCCCISVQYGSLQYAASTRCAASAAAMDANGTTLSVTLVSLTSNSVSSASVSSSPFPDGAFSAIVLPLSPPALPMSEDFSATISSTRGPISRPLASTRNGPRPWACAAMKLVTWPEATSTLPCSRSATTSSVLTMVWIFTCRP